MSAPFPTAPLSLEEPASLSERYWIEERVNTITHGIGFVLGAVACTWLMITVSRSGSRLQVFGCAVYTLTLLATYAASTLSHALHGPRIRRAMRIADQGSIFLFIAGTWAPTACTWLRAPAWWPVHVGIYAIAIYGFLSKVVFAHRVAAGSVTTRLQVFLGCIPILLAWPLLRVLPMGLCLGIAAGGACYLIGVVVFFFDRGDRFLHALWHLLVIAGSALHFAAIYRYCTAA